MDLTGKTLVTPSRPNYWTGTPREGAPYTEEQYRRLDQLGPDLLAKVRRYRLPTSFNVTLRSEPTRTHVAGVRTTIVCPVVSSTRDRTRLQVIAPNGLETWVDWK